MKQTIRHYRNEAIGLFVGAAAGWLYWKFIGCTSSSCAITSSPLNSSLYGAAMGGLIGGIFKKNEQQPPKS